MERQQTMTTTSIQRGNRTPAQVLAQQKADAERQQKQAGSWAAPAVAPQAPTPVVPDNRTATERYVDEIAPSTIAGKLVKFSKDGQFVISETGDAIDPNADFVAMADETLIGWIRFNGQDAPPDRHQGLLYDGFVMPDRKTLGDLDPTKWELGLSGQPADPWQHQICLVLQHRATLELFTFTTSSTTGRRAIGNLLRHYDRMRRSDADNYPVVRLKPGGFNHRDERIGWVPVPTFAAVGKAPKASAAVPDTSVDADMNDSLPFGL